MSRPTLVATAAVAVVAAIAVTFAFVRGGASPASGTRAGPPSAAGTDTDTGVSAVTPDAPVADGSDDPALVELPDGSLVPCLNDALGAPPLARSWAPDRPFAPIVGVERSDAGVDWYVHEDGTRSTTVMVWRADLARHDALTRVAHPGPAPPAPRQDR